jgi:hypothetical protein
VEEKKAVVVAGDRGEKKGLDVDQMAKCGDNMPSTLE